MSIGDILSDIGKGAATGARAVGAVLPPVLQRTAQVLSGEAPQIDEEKRQQATQMDDAALNAKADELEAQLAMGRKYGTLTPQQQQQYVDQITGLFSHPKHMNTLMTRLQKAIHPGGATYQQGEPLPSATPVGGTVAADARLANAKKGERPVPGVHPFKAADGQYYQPMYTPDGSVVNELVQGYTPPPEKAAGKSPPVTGDKLPPDAVGVDGDPIPPEQRTAGQSFVEYQGKWWPVAPPKPVFKTVQGHAVLVDARSGAILRDLGPVAGVKVTQHQTLQPGDDGQMHMVSLTSVTTPEGATIDVQPETEGSSTGGTAQPSAPSSAPKTPAKKVGSILPRTGAKPATSAPGGPVVPGLSMLAHSKNPMYKDQVAQYAKQIPILDSTAQSIQDYIQNGVFDGPGDLALQHEFFTATQPSTGFRMTKVQQDILQNSQGWLNSLEARGRHVATGSWYSDEQRKQIAQTALEAIKAKKKALQDALDAAQGGAAPAGAGVAKVIVVSPEDMK